MSLRDALQAVYDEYGKLTPRLVVDLARDDTHPLHSHFEWDDEIAGEKWRLTQAGELIRSVRVVYAPATEKKPQKSVRAYHAVREEDGDHIYRHLDDVAHDPFARQLVLREAERDWKAFKRRYDGLAEVLSMVRKDVAS